jgi:hypothetical protein
MGISDPGEITLTIECDSVGLDALCPVTEAGFKQFVITAKPDRAWFTGVCTGLELIFGWSRLLAILGEADRDATKLRPAMVEYCRALVAWEQEILGLSISSPSSRAGAIELVVAANDRMMEAEEALQLKPEARARFYP